MTEKEQFEEDMKKLLECIDTKKCVHEFLQAIDDKEKWGGAFDNPSPHPDK